MMDDSTIVGGGMAVIAIIGWLVCWRPNAPDPNDPDEAPEAMGEGMAGLLAVLMVTVGIIVWVLL
jgi:hypothetical protein